MKNSLRLLQLLLLTAFLMSSCNNESDDDPIDNSPKNFLSYNDESYDLAIGALESFGNSDSSDYKIDLTFGSLSIYFHQANGGIFDLYGTGYAIRFHVYNDAPETLESGEYTFDTDALTAGTFNYGIVYIDYPGPYQDAEGIAISSGTLSVTNKGNDKYDISFTCSTTEGNTVTGNFNDYLKTYNYEL